jgi:hypothetical protein
MDPGSPPTGILPENILKILGISAVVPAASLGLNHNKYRAVHIASCGVAPDPNGDTAHRFVDFKACSGCSSILLEGGSSSITRLQMLFGLGLVFLFS